VTSIGGLSSSEHLHATEQIFQLKFVRKSASVAKRNRAAMPMIWRFRVDSRRSIATISGFVSLTEQAGVYLLRIKLNCLQIQGLSLNFRSFDECRSQPNTPNYAELDKSPRGSPCLSAGRIVVAFRSINLDYNASRSR